MSIRGHSGASSQRKSRTARGNAVDTGRALLTAYLERGSLSARERSQVDALLEEGEARRFPTHAGTRLETALYLVRVALVALQLLAAGEARAVEQHLVGALLSGTAETAVAEPFDGLLFLVGERVAHELGDEDVAGRMAAGARQVTVHRSRQTAAVRGLLGLPGAGEGPFDN